MKHVTLNMFIGRQFYKITFVRKRMLKNVINYNKIENKSKYLAVCIKKSNFFNLDLI